MYIHGIGHYHPKHLIDNAFLDEPGIAGLLLELAAANRQ